MAKLVRLAHAGVASSFVALARVIKLPVIQVLRALSDSDRSRGQGVTSPVRATLNHERE